MTVLCKIDKNDLSRRYILGYELKGTSEEYDKDLQKKVDWLNEQDDDYIYCYVIVNPINPDKLIKQASDCIF